MNPARTHSSAQKSAPVASLQAQATGRALWQQRSAAEQRQAENDLRTVERHLTEARQTLATLRAQAQTATETAPNAHEYSDAMLAEYAGMQLNPARQVSVAELPIACN